MFRSGGFAQNLSKTARPLRDTEYRPTPSASRSGGPDPTSFQRVLPDEYTTASLRDGFLRDLISGESSLAPIIASMTGLLTPACLRAISAPGPASNWRRDL